MKLHKSYLRILLLLLLVFLPKVAWGTSYYYVKVDVGYYSTYNPARGSVYVVDSDGKDNTTSTLSTTTGLGKITFELKATANTGYTFEGWHSSQNDGQIIDGSKISPWQKPETAPNSSGTDNTISKTYYAEFSIVPYTIKYNTNGGNPASISDQGYDIETDSISLPSKPTKDESKFTGWTVTSTDEGQHNWDPTIESETSSISGSKFGNVTLTAGWETKTYTAKFFDGETELTALEISYTKAGGLTMPVYSKNYYDFQYWELDNTDGQGWNEYQYNEGVKYSDRNGNVKFKAKCKAINYTISYEKNGGEWSAPGLTSYTYETPSISLPQNMTKDESKFTGWTVTSTDGGQHNWDPTIGSETSSISGSKFGNVTLTARWETKTYTAKFYDGETELTALEISYTKADGFTLPEYSKPYYSFKNWEVIWTDGQDWTDGPYDANFKISGKNGNVKFRAVWDMIEYTITYDPSGGTLIPNENTQIYTYETNPITLYEVTKEESTFNGWEVASTDGSENNWPTSGYITAPSIKGPKYGNVTLTAAWDVITYKVEFFDCDGKTPLNLLPNSYSKVDGFVFPSYSKPGYSVDYWEVFETSGGGWTNDEAEQNYKPGNKINGKNAAVKFKAHYKLETYTITFKHNDGKDTESSMTYDYEHDFTLTVPEKSGCDFKGWKPEAASGSWSGSQLYSGTVEAGTAYGDVTLIAQWLGGLIVILEGSEDVSEDCYAVFKVSGGGVEYLISVSKNHPEVLGSLENGVTYTIESMGWHKAYVLDSIKQEVDKVDDEQTVTFNAEKKTTKVSDTHKDF